MANIKQIRIGNITYDIHAPTATADANGNAIISTYETKSDASSKLLEAKTYADSAATKVKNDLLNGAGGAYDTLKELGDLIDDNQDAIEALETIAASKADAGTLTSHINNQSNPHKVTTTQIGAVPTSRTINGKALSDNISLSASDVGADASGSANTALTDAKAYANSLASNYATASQGAKADSAIQELSAGVGLKITNKNNIELDDTIVFIFNCGSSTELI